MRSFRIIPLVAVAVLGVAVAPLARAASSEITKQIERLNKKALEDYDALEFESAKQTLLTAVGKLRENGLDEKPIAAKTYVNLGIVYFAGFNDQNRGITQFVNALKIDPTIQLDPDRATPELKQAFESAREQAGPATKKPDAGTPPPPETADAGTPPEDQGNAPAQGLVHNPVDEARRGQRVTIRAHLDPALGATRMFLFYRTGGQEDFVSVPMDKGDDDNWAADIPPESVTTKTVQYYIEARDGRGKTMTMSGSAASPYIIAVVGKGDTENPLQPDAGTKEPTPSTERGYGRLFLNVMVGTGVGIEPGGNHTEVAYQFQNNQYGPQTVDSAGGAVAQLHIGAELGVNINSHIAVSILGRFQILTGANADSSDSTVQLDNGEGGTAKASGAVAVLGRFRYSFLDGRVHPYIHFDVGGGQIRHLLNISLTSDNPDFLVDKGSADQYNAHPTTTDRQKLRNVCNGHDQNCADTIATGPYLFGGGFGLSIDLSNWGNGALSFIVDANALIATGDQTGFNFDLQLGFGLSVF